MIAGILMHSHRERPRQKVVEITVQSLGRHQYVCTERLSECERAHGDWICGACGRGFVTALPGSQCAVCQATVLAVAYE